MDVTRAPYLKIVEQPASKALRFRYECEGRSAGTIPGIHSTPENRTYPTVQVIWPCLAQLFYFIYFNLDIGKRGVNFKGPVEIPNLEHY